MLESVVATILNKFLGNYVENFDPKQLNIGIWGGDVKLRNLRLRKESLDDLKLPIDVKFGHLGELTLKIPWSNLKAKPVKVSIEDVYLLAAPILSETYNQEDEIKRELALKLRKLVELEIKEKSNPNNSLSPEDAAKNENFAQSLITKIVDNLQFEIKRIHLRYEDMSNVFSDQPYSIGITLDELSAVSTDEQWNPTFISVSKSLTHKLLVLKSLCAYWNTKSYSIYSEDHNEILEKFKQSIIDEDNLSSYEEFTQFILRPVSGTGHLTVSKLGATDTQPHIKTEVFFEEFSVDLDSEQYKDALWTASKFHWYKKTHRFKKFRPQVPLKGNGEEWFRYAANSVLSEIHDKNYRWSWEFLKKRRDNRKAYIPLWKKRLLLPENQQQLANPAEAEELRLLEEELPYEDIKYFRSLAKSELRRELSEKSAAEIALKKVVESSKPKSGGWLSWWSSENQNEKSQDSIVFTDEQRGELYDAIEYDETRAISDAISVPRERVNFEINAQLRRGGFSIKSGPNRKELAKIIFDGCSLQHFQRQDSFLSKFTLQEFKVEDGTGTTLYKDFISVKSLDSDAKLQDSTKEPFFQAAFEHNPLDGSADSTLLAKLKSITIFYNVGLINEIVRFFKPPKVHLETINAIMDVAEATVEGITTQTRLGLEAIWEEHKTINAQLDLQAPLIIIPLDSNSWSSPCAVIDAGHISLGSDLADKDKSNEIRNLSPEEYAKVDVKDLDKLMYDKFNLHLQNTQVLIGPSIKSTIEQLNHSAKSSSLILEKLDFKILLELSILPGAANLAKIKANAHLPNLSAKINDYQYKIMMQLIDKSIPNFDVPDDDDEYSLPLNISQGKNSELTISGLVDHDTEYQNSFPKAKYSEAYDNQHMFELKFDIDKVELLLSKCTDGSSMAADEIVDLVAQRFKLDFQRSNSGNIHVGLTLGTFEIDDWVDKSAPIEFKKLVSSSNSTKSKNIFNLEYNRIKRIAKHADKDIEVFDQDVDLDLSELRVIVTRKSLLTILNFVLTTFTDPNPPETEADALRYNDSSQIDSSPQQIRVKVNLERIILILNDEGIKLATLQLSTAHFDVLLLPEKIKVYSKLGGLTLHDEINEGSVRDSVLRKLLSFDADEMAEFTYETYPNSASVEYQSKILFKAGSLRLNFVEEPLNKILDFLNKFQRMKLYFDLARIQAFDQVTIQNQNIAFDVKIKTPIIVFPHLVDFEPDLYDNLTVYLGQFYARNEYQREPRGLINKIECGLKSGKLNSLFHFGKNVQSLDIIDNFDIIFDIFHHENPIKKAKTVISGHLTEINADLTEFQLRYLYSLSQTIPNVFVYDEASLSEIEDAALNANKVIAPYATYGTGQEALSGLITNSADSTDPDSENIDFKFEIPYVSLSLHNNTRGISNLENTGISKFSLEKIGLTFFQKKNSHFISNFHIGALTVEDIRRMKNNQFTEIIPKAKEIEHQFSVDISTDGPADEKITVATLRVNSPKIIIALDYLFALKSFIDSSLNFSSKNNLLLKGASSDDAIKDLVPVNASTLSNKPNQVLVDGPARFGFTVNVIDTSLILLEDPTSISSEAVVFKIEQLLASSQNISSASVNNVGMFLCKMDQYETNRIRIIDDFSASISIDGRKSTNENLLTSIHISAEPLVIRVSLNDIRLAVSIFNKAVELSKQNGIIEEDELKDNGDEATYTTFTNEFKRKLTKYAPSIFSSLSGNDRVSHYYNEPEILIKAETLFADIEGMRLVVIGNINELPVLDMEVNPFQLSAKNWSSDFEADTTIESNINIYNYAKSAWESLIDPWPFSIHISKTQGEKSKLNVEMISKKLAELSLSSSSIALLSKLFYSISGEGEVKGRGAIKPYRIINETGYKVKIWSFKNSNQFATIEDGEDLSWEFEDWRQLRENLNTSTENDKLGVSLIGSKYDDLENISVTHEGEEVYILQPQLDGIHNRVSVEIKLGPDNVKVIALRSTITIVNDTQIPIVIKGKTQFTIPPNSQRSVPIDEVYDQSFCIKPNIKVPFDWSENNLFWRRLSKAGGTSVRCPSQDKNDSTSFYFQAEAKYDKNEPLTRLYPHMKITLSAPLEIENLLPYDINYRLYDRSSKRDWKNSLAKGRTSPVHVIKLEHFLLLSVQPVDTGFAKSDFAIINAPESTEFKRESNLCLKREDGQSLNLGLHYTSTENNGAGTKVIVYSPYVILNKTDRDIFVSQKYNVMHSLVSKEEEKEEDLQNFRSTKPGLFSYDEIGDVSSRALVRLDNSQWSKPISFETIGQVSQIDMPLRDNRSEANFGLSVKEGGGKYKLTKVVTIAPRYIVRNSLNEGIQILLVGSSDPLSIDSSKTAPLYNLPKIQQKQAQIRLLGGKSRWSAPFNIKDVGQIFLKVFKQEVGHILLKLTVLLEESSIFINVEDGGNHWPFSIRNFSNFEFLFYQKNPDLDENDQYSQSAFKNFKPIYYKIPPKSVMPYAWDYPAGIMKELVLMADGRERHIQLAEIGNLKPMKLSNDHSIVDFNVVADGPTQSLVISNYDQSLSLYKLHDSSTTSSASVNNSSKFKVVEEDSEITTQVIFKFEGIGVSLINTRLQELCYISARGLELRLNDSDLYQTASVKLKWIQIDNQLFGGIYPIILYPTVVPQSVKEMNSHPAFSGSISRVKDDSHGVLFIKYATLLLQEMSLEIDEDFLYALLDFLKLPGSAWEKSTQDVLCEDIIIAPEYSESFGGSDIYFEVLHIQPAQLNLSFVRTERVNVEDKTSGQNAISFFFNILTMAVGNVNDAPIRLNALLTENVRAPLPALIQNIETHYGQAFFSQIHKVIGSADLIGNPVGLFNNISSGVMDIFYEPYQGLVMNDRPQELGISVAKGGLSFLKKTVYGFSDSFAKVTGSIAKGLTAATLDKDFQERRRLNQRRNKPKHALYGLGNGATSFLDGFASGISGIALDPVQGASTGGTAGFFRGVGKGLIGLPTKTAIGIFDLANQVSEGIRNTTTAFDGGGLDKVRLPRYIGRDAIIKPYEERESQGQFWLKTSSGGRYINEDYLSHVVLPGGDMVLIVTYRLLLLVATSVCEIKWAIEFDDIRAITQENTGIKIGMVQAKQGPFIPIPDANSRKFIYNKIAIAVNDYNKHSQVIL
ncbi:hypothetical protein WICMUC_005742 [Wickerhamomyces mucosus]|uniref:Vacuolar protein sorting-associated protein n=1 Tax=Wickerhamomyces mucosus TaxID=1378264 RepID=A0A9P8P344_9ASCO|nr:hypothetical protein WICMUC_005742 [Wickerhamomyces mucosus]